jgi:phosphoribosylformylglycinamidine synthase
LVQSAHDCSDGGLAVALAESCVSGPGEKFGAVIQLALDGLRRDALLFGETQSRVLISVRATHADRVLNTAWDAGVPAARIGTVGGDRLTITLEGDSRTSDCILDVDLAEIFDRWDQAIPRALAQD